MTSYTKITVNINKSLWAAFNLFAHSDFAIRRDALIATWIHRFFGTLQLDQMYWLREEIPKNDDDWQHIVRDLRRTFKRSLKPAVITLHTEIADQLNAFCEEKAINRDRFIEQILYQALVSDQPDSPMRDRVQKSALLYIGPLDMMVGMLLQIPYRDLGELATHPYFIFEHWDAEWLASAQSDCKTSNLSYTENDFFPQWLNSLLFTDDDLANHKKGLFPQDKIMAPPIGYWVFMRAYRHHIFVPSSDYSDPDFLTAEIKKYFAQLVSPPVLERLVQGLSAYPRTKGSDGLLKFAYKSLAQGTGIRDLGFEVPYDFEEEVFNEPSLFSDDT